jgi:SagB-type dehydrogenase family enzyme
MPKFHQQTSHSYFSIRNDPHYLDWHTQPQNSKIYPHFCHRYKIKDINGLEDLDLIGGITFEKKYSEGIFHLRSNPSAGALYPCEIYVQMKKAKGFVNGIYHYEPINATLTLLEELSDDGVEYYFNDTSYQEGFIFLISAIYFRSSWKYRDRSIRYILLDSGHQLGAVYAALSLMDRESKIVFDFDKISLNEKFGFRNDEMFTVALSSSSLSDRETKELKSTLPYICGCDYLETNPFIEDAYKQSAEYKTSDIPDPKFFKGIPKEELKKAITNRRSIRAFEGSGINKDEFEFILKDIFKFAISHNIDIFYTLHDVNEMQEGLYRNGSLLKDGNFRAKSKYFALEQNLGGESAVTFYFTSNDDECYQKVNILSGFIGHIIYLRSGLKGIGCSGLGAYYDDEAKSFLDTKNNILYLLAIGR